MNQMQPLNNPHNANLKPLPKLFSASGSYAYKRIEKRKSLNLQEEKATIVQLTISINM
jgi:hypothetical protein